MSIQWNWEHHMGKVDAKCIDGSWKTIDIYRPNSLAILLDGKVSVVAFFADERHLKDCIKDGILENFQNWRLNAKYPESIKIAKILVKEGETVILYHSDSKVPWELQN